MYIFEKKLKSDDNVLANRKFTSHKTTLKLLSDYMNIYHFH